MVEKDKLNRKFLFKKNSINIPTCFMMNTIFFKKKNNNNNNRKVISFSKGQKECTFAKKKACTKKA
jgi:hypothetical protein